MTILDAIIVSKFIARRMPETRADGRESPRALARLIAAFALIAVGVVMLDAGACPNGAAPAVAAH